MSSLNHFICPNCGHDFYYHAAWAVCDACQRFFYAADSATCNFNRRTIKPTELGVYKDGIYQGPVVW